MKKNFENNGLVDTRIPPKKRAREIAEIWGEGYEPLINVLELCIKNNVRTLSCCSGHDTEYNSGDPYIYFKADSALAYYILDRMLEDDNAINIIAINRNPISNAPSFAIHGLARAREEFFNKISGLIQEYVKEHKRNSKIRGIKKLDKIYKRNYSNESLIKKILFLCYSKYFNKLIVYTPKTKTYNYMGGNTEYTEKEFEKMYPKEFLMDEEQRKNISVIEKIKQKCQNSKVGLNRLGELYKKFQKNEKEMQMAEEER